MSRLPVAQLSFADLQLQSHGVHLDPTLQRVADFLEEQTALIELVRQDLERGLKKPDSGRHGITPAQTLRSLVLMRLKNWDFRELRERVNDGFTLRSFTQFDSHSVPKHDAFNRAFNRITPATLVAVNQLVVQAAVKLGLEDGRQLRVDTTVVETNIHYPTDATLLWDTVRTVTRLVWDLHEKLPRGVKGFTDRTRSARRRMQEIQRMTARQREQQQIPKYRELIRITEQVLGNARKVIAAAKRVHKVDEITRAVIDAICKQIADFSQLGDRVIDQSRRRVLQGETVPAEEKLYSIFEPHTDLIKRGKTLKPVEFGHKVFLAESAHGLITEYRVLDGNPVDSDHVQASLEHHQKTFQHAPDCYAADRGFYSLENVQNCKDAGVSQVCIPQRGGQKTAEQEELERSRAFKKGQRFRVGIEGRISVLFRGRGMKRCLLKGRERFEILVGAAVLANNLMRIADLLDKRKPDRRRAAA
ncbi:MAG: ISNCY family transposase [Candidatus Sulfotelmatobacter sp.]